GVLFAATFALFRTERTGTGRKLWRRKGAKAVAEVTPRPAYVHVPRVMPTFGGVTTRGQFLKQLRFDTLGVFRSVPFLVLLAFGVANFLPVALDLSLTYGSPVYPVTSQMLQALQQSYGFLLVIIVL